MINGPDAGPIKVAYERYSRQTKRVLGRNDAEEVWVVFNCVNGVGVRVGDLSGRALLLSLLLLLLLLLSFGVDLLRLLRLFCFVLLRVCAREGGRRLVVFPRLGFGCSPARGASQPVAVSPNGGLQAASRRSNRASVSCRLTGSAASRATHLDEIEEVGGLRDGICANPTGVAVEQHLLGLLVDHVKELLQAYGGVALFGWRSVRFHVNAFRRVRLRLAFVFVNLRV